MKVAIEIKKKECNLLKPITINFIFTNDSDQVIRINKSDSIYINILENDIESDDYGYGYGYGYGYESTSLKFGDQDYFELQPSENFLIKEKYLLTFQYTYSQVNRTEPLTLKVKLKYSINSLSKEKIKAENSFNLNIDYTHVKVLNTNNGEALKYILYNDEVVYISENCRAYERPSKKLSTNKQHIKVFNRMYIADKEKIFRDGNIQYIKPANFKVYNELYAGNNHKILTTYGDAKVKAPESFEVFKIYKGVGEYARGYARDKFHVYFFDEATSITHATIVKACKAPETFKELFVHDEYVYGICERTVYINGVSISMPQAETWNFLGHYSKDKKRVYYHTYKVDQADPNSFEVILDPEENEYNSSIKRKRYYGLENSTREKDNKHYFCCGKLSSKKEYEAEVKYHKTHKHNKE